LLSLFVTLRQYQDVKYGKGVMTIISDLTVTNRVVSVAWNTCVCLENHETAALSRACFSEAASINSPITSSITPP
jgi:hypothetical protein